MVGLLDLGKIQVFFYGQRAGHIGVRLMDTASSHYEYELVYQKLQPYLTRTGGELVNLGKLVILFR